MIFFAFLSGFSFNVFIHSIENGDDLFRIILSGGMTIIWLLDAYLEKIKLKRTHE